MPDGSDVARCTPLQDDSRRCAAPGSLRPPGASGFVAAILLNLWLGAPSYYPEMTGATAAWLAALVVIAHFAFVGFVLVGALGALRWPWVAGVHLPAAAWAAYIEVSGGICPLTPLENALRARAGLDVYSTDFVARYLFPVLYPEGLTREIQMALGALVVGVNVGLYAFVYVRRRTRHRR